MRPVNNSSPDAGTLWWCMQKWRNRINQNLRAAPQGRNEVRWCPGQKTSLAPPWSNRRPHCQSLAPPRSKLSFSESKFTVLKKVLVTLLGLLGGSRSNSAPPQWFSAPIVNWRSGNCAPLAPCRYAPAAPTWSLNSTECSIHPACINLACVL